jgi:hypothetical protein
MSINVNFTFDESTYRHYMNGHASVLHCHHYMCLTVKLAEDMEKIGGTTILAETAEDSIRPLFDDYFKSENIAESSDRFRIGEEYFAVMGLGKISVNGNVDGGEVKLLHSHVDEGWLKKWGKSDKPVNHFSRGYAAALFAATFTKAPRSYVVSEETSIAMGAPEGKLIVKLA